MDDGWGKASRAAFLFSFATKKLRRLNKPNLDGSYACKKVPLQPPLFTQSG